jgi:arylsulfatase A-like enzyme
MDLFATFLRLAKAKSPSDRPIDGVDVWPALAGGASPRSEFLFYSSNWDSIAQVMAIRSGPWKLHFTHGPGAEFVPNGLYQVEQDPGETTDQAKGEPAVVERLAARARAMSASIRPGAQQCPPLPEGYRRAMEQRAAGSK